MNKSLRRLEIDPTRGKDVTDQDFELMMGQFVYALENGRCPNCQARVRFDYNQEEVLVKCPQGDYQAAMGAGMVLELGHFLAVTGEADTLLEAVTRILDEIKFQREGRHERN